MLGTILKRAWSPLDEFEAMERVFSNIYHDTRPTDSPSAEHWIKDDTAHLVMELPGVSRADVEMAIEGQTLTVKGERKATELEDTQSWHRRERWHGKFEKAFTLPFNVEESKVKATFKDGLLSVELPKAEADKPRKIAITAK